MEKTTLSKQFSYRLRDAMLAAGFNSNRSPSGVSLHVLAEMTGYSLQICRKYMRGEAIPEPAKLMELASKLKVSPGWLLFGDAHTDNNLERSKITISKNLLHYICKKAECIYNSKLKEAEVADFLLDLINDVSLINANEEQSQKIIDLALSSVKHFSQP